MKTPQERELEKYFGLKSDDELFQELHRIKNSKDMSETAKQLASLFVNKVIAERKAERIELGLPPGFDNL